MSDYSIKLGDSVVHVHSQDEMHPVIQMRIEQLAVELRDGMYSNMQKSYKKPDWFA